MIIFLVLQVIREHLVFLICRVVKYVASCERHIDIATLVEGYTTWLEGD
jgi:hypothetical protein